MYRVVFIVIVSLAFSSADIDEKCFKLFRPELMFCCVKPPPVPSEKMDFKECADLPMNVFSTCDKPICMAKKNGFLSADGKMNKKAFKDKLEKDFPNQPEMVDLIQNKCIDGDFTSFAPKDLCDVMKMKNCMQIQFLSQCPEFIEEGDCSGTAALVQECSSSFP